MAPKSKSRFVDHPPSVSSSEEEQEQVEDSGEEEEESGEEESGEETEEEARPSVKKPIVPKSPQSQQSSSNDNGSGSDAESDSGQSQPSPPSVSIKSSAKSKLPAKRPQEAQKESKMKKKPKKEEEKKSSGTPVKLWSDEDQLAVLRGMVEFKAQNPNADMSFFHDFVKGKLQEEGVTKSRLREKIRGLKKKFMPYMNTSEKPSFARTVDNTMFELAKKIWGGGKDHPSNSVVVKENVNGKPKKTVAADLKKTVAEPKKSSKVTKPKEDLKVKEDMKAKDDETQVAAAKKVVKEDVVEERGDEFRSKYPHLAAAFNPADMTLRYPENTSLIPSDKAKVLEVKMKKLHQEETELMIKRLGLMKEYYELLADANRGN